MLRQSDRPCLRPGLAAQADERIVHIWDRLRLVQHVLKLTALEFTVLQMLDGTRTLLELQAEVTRHTGGVLVPLDHFSSFVEQLDTHLFLDTPRFRTRIESPIREPACIGAYSGEADELRSQLAALFTAPGGPGLPLAMEPDGTLTACLVPHIDYRRGALSYAWGFKEVFERTRASLFVIIGTAHYSPARFTLTRQHFRTPLGLVDTDQGYIDRLVAHHGDGLFSDPFAHFPEHSIELEVVILQYLYESRRPIRIVPLLVGSFQDCVKDGLAPDAKEDISRMVRALRAVESETREPICYLISGDLAHIGPKFADPDPVAAPLLGHSRRQDETLLRLTESIDMSGYSRFINAEQDRRRICGFPPTWTTLQALLPQQGRILHYDQFVDPTGVESVSFASVGFYGRRQ